MTSWAPAEDSGRLALLAAYTPDRLADMVRTAYAHLRSQGERHPRLPEMTPPRAAGQREALVRRGRGAGRAGRERDGHGRADPGRSSTLRGGPGGPGAGEVADPAEIKKLGFKATAKVLQGPACEAYIERHAAYMAYCVHYREHNDHVLVRELMALYGGHYAAMKRDRSALDFDDLELVARDLLNAHDGVREQYRDRFTHVMVDEFQDTNPLQNELLTLLQRDNLFRVGDERQSIYGFRHADVKVFRRHLARLGRGEGGADDCQLPQPRRGAGRGGHDLRGPLGPGLRRAGGATGARDQPPRAEPCVELLVTDRDKGRWEERFPPNDEGDEPSRSATASAPWT